MHFRILTAFLLLQVVCSNELRLFPNDFGEPVLFEIRYSNGNLTYQMWRPLKDVCAPERNIRVLIFIITGPENFDKRQAIRETWMHDKSNPDDYHSLFIIGRINNKFLEEKVLEEQRRYGDIIRYNVLDLYDMLPFKTHAAFSWKQTFCPTAQYLMKTDDDTAVYLKRLDHFVRTEFDLIVNDSPEMLFCNFRENDTPHRYYFSKYFVSTNEFNRTIFPNYCPGASYLVSEKAVTSLLNHTKHVPFLRLEDVLMTGAVAEIAKVRHHSAGAFGYEAKNYCDAQNVPYLSVMVGLPVSKIPPAYRLLKNFNCNSRQKNILYHDYHQTFVWPF